MFQTHYFKITSFICFRVQIIFNKTIILHLYGHQIEKYTQIKQGFCLFNVLCFYKHSIKCYYALNIQLLTLADLSFSYTNISGLGYICLRSKEGHGLLVRMCSHQCSVRKSWYCLRYMSLYGRMNNCNIMSLFSL